MIVLDTHVFLWLHLEPERMPESIVLSLKANDQMGISAISLWEIAMLNSRKRISIPGSLTEWFDAAFANQKIRLLPLTPKIAAKAESLPIHGDPADRIIAATAIEHDSPLATRDRLLLGFKELRTIQ